MQRQRNHGHNAALTAIIRTHDKHDVFDRNDDNQGPQDERKNPEQVIRGQRNRVEFPAKTSFIVYRGLVPISPGTTPSAANANAACCDLFRVAP